MAKKFQLNELQILKTLGTGILYKGSFGRVKMTRIKATGECIALKILKKAEILRLKQVDHVLCEFSILRSLNHPFIVNLLGYAQDERYLYLALEYVPGGELFKYLRNLGRLELNHTQLFAGQITLIFEYLHSMNIVYRDLKPENILLSPDGYIKLTDFGFAKIVEGRTYTLCGTPEYLAPEILLNKGHGKPVDWWTLGILVYEMIVGIDPFSDTDVMIIYQKILKCKVKFPRNIDKDAKSLIKRLLVVDLSKRYGNLKKGVEDVKSHKFFETIEWQKLIRRGFEMPYRPNISSPDDTSNFPSYPDSVTLSPPIKPSDDPFNNW
jgi:serine/threonine protein kinase